MNFKQAHKFVADFAGAFGFFGVGVRPLNHVVVLDADDCQSVIIMLPGEGFDVGDVPGGESRGGHAHKNLQQLIVSVMGAFDVILDDGRERRRVHLDRGYNGLCIPPMIWREIENFSSGGICLVLASELYDASDYMRDYQEFLNIKMATDSAGGQPPSP